MKNKCFHFGRFKSLQPLWKVPVAESKWLINFDNYYLRVIAIIKQELSLALADICSCVQQHKENINYMYNAHSIQQRIVEQTNKQTVDTSSKHSKYFRWSGMKSVTNFTSIVRRRVRLTITGLFLVLSLSPQTVIKIGPLCGQNLGHRPFCVWGLQKRFQVSGKVCECAKSGDNNKNSELSCWLCGTVMSVCC